MTHTPSPKRPYLLRAYYDWLVDNDFTPYLVVDANYYGNNVPVEYVKDGQIVLNLSAGATGNLQLTNDFIQFNARFQGVARELYIPMGAALAIYARENGDGVMFEPEDIYDELGFLQFAPILFASALTKQRIHRLADMLKFVSEQQYRRVSTGTLNQLLQDAQTVNPVPSRNGRIPKIYYMTQASVKPPTFILCVNEPELIHVSYMRFVENRLRESFGFEGTPIRLVLRGKKREDED